MHAYILAKLKEKKVKSESDIFYYQTEKFQYNFYNKASPNKAVFCVSIRFAQVVGFLTTSGGKKFNHLY